jgi:hypothetical protein
LHGATEQNYEQFIQDSWFLSQYLNPGSPKYEAGVLIVWPQQVLLVAVPVTVFIFGICLL